MKKLLFVMDAERDFNMSYDFDGVSDLSPIKLNCGVSFTGSDLEAIVMLLELAAIYLTPKPNTEFTFEQLLDQANEISGGEIVIDAVDAKIVLDNSSILGKLPGGRYYLK